MMPTHSPADPHVVSPLLVAPPQMAAYAEDVGLEKTRKATSTIFLLAITAGAFIALAFVFAITIWTGSSALPWGVNRLIGGLVFSTGLCMLVVLGGDLFTSSILSCVACASGRLPLRRLLSYWSLVYVGNIVGSLIIVALMYLGRVHELAGGQWGQTLLNVASHKVDHDVLQAVVLGILCNLLVCIAVWMSYATRSIGARAALVILPVSLFVSAGFEHVVANMFLLPYAVLLDATHAVPAIAGHAPITLVQVIRDNILPVTLGNIIGGLMVGMMYWALYRRAPKAVAANSEETASAPLLRKAVP